MYSPVSLFNVARTLTFRRANFTSLWLEWLGLGVIAAIDVVWARGIGFHLLFGAGDFNVLLALVGVAICLGMAGQQRLALVAEYLALSLAMANVFTVFSYLALASSGALVDRQLLAADLLMGFHWFADYQFVAAHPFAVRAMDLLYNSMNLQALYVCVLLGVMNRKHSLRELFWLIFIAALLTNLSAIEFPALGPFQVYGLASHGGFLPDMLHLKSGHDLTFEFSRLTGVISFPSFHTVLALAYAYGARDTSIIGYAMAGANFLVLFCIPFIGGHYLVDMIAGLAVTLLSLLVVRTLFAPRTVKPVMPAEAAASVN